MPRKTARKRRNEEKSRAFRGKQKAKEDRIWMENKKKVVWMKKMDVGGARGKKEDPIRKKYRYSEDRQAVKWEETVIEGHTARKITRTPS